MARSPFGRLRKLIDLGLYADRHTPYMLWGGSTEEELMIEWGCGTRF